MTRARDQGKIRYIGFSFHDVLPVYKEIIDYFDWDVTQIQYNYMDTAIQVTEEGLKYAGSKNIAVVPCASCQYCMNCPSGVNIPQNFTILNNVAMDNSTLSRWRMKRSYKRLIDDPEKLNEDKTNGNARICTECGICVSKCPQSINFPEELKKVDMVLGKGKKLKDIQEIYNLGD